VPVKQIGTLKQLPSDVLLFEFSSISDGVQMFIEKYGYKPKLILGFPPRFFKPKYYIPTKQVVEV